MFVTAHFTRYRTDEFIQFFKFILKIAEEKNIEELQLTKEVGALRDKTAELEAAWKISQGSALTPAVKKTDDRRDKAHICLYGIAEAYTNHFEESKREAAQMIIDCIDKYGSRIHKFNYVAQTSTMSNILADFFASPELMAAIELLHMTELVEEIQTANQLFEQLYIQRNKETTDGETTITMSALKDELMPIYKHFTEIVNAHILISPNKEQYLALRNEINHIVERYNSIVAKRNSSKNNGEDENTEQNEVGNDPQE